MRCWRRAVADAPGCGALVSEVDASEESTRGNPYEIDNYHTPAAMNSTLAKAAPPSPLLSEAKDAINTIHAVTTSAACAMAVPVLPT